MAEKPEKAVSQNSSEVPIEKAQLSDDVPISEEINSTAEKALIRKLDLHLIPIIMLLYLFSFLDRGMYLPVLPGAKF